MPKMILTIISTCIDCPHLAHSDVFTPRDTKALCQKQYKDRELPKPIHINSNGEHQLRFDYAIPSWCPLDEMPTKNKGD